MLLSFALVAFVAGGKPPPPEPPAAPDEAVTLTKRLFSAFRARNAGDFAAVTGLPFTYGTTYPPKARRCDGTSNNESQLRQRFDCVLKTEELLVHELAEFSEELNFVGDSSRDGYLRRFDPKSERRFDPMTSLPKALVRRAAILRRSGVSLFAGAILGNGVTYEYVVTIRGTGNEARVVGLVLDVTVYE
jgi:hypothetical protein